MKKVLIAKNLAGLFPEKDNFLERASIRVITAASNDDVLRACLQEHADLIVISLDMPGMKCEELIQNVRSNDRIKSVSVILVAQDTLAHRERIKQCKANAVFTTPVDMQLLQLKIQQFLNVAPRLVYRATLAVAIEGKFKNQPLPFWTENISENGMLIKTEEPLEIGAGVFLSFFLHDGTHVTSYGEIVRAEQPSENAPIQLYGVKFTNIDEEAKRAIKSVVARKRRSKAV